jgi:hypothetical protein
VRAPIVPMPCHAVLVLSCRRIHGRGYALLVKRPVERCTKHETGISWNDPSGDRLRNWLGLTPEQFYDLRKVAIVPMGFCYPGKAASGDNLMITSGLSSTSFSVPEAKEFP